MLLGTTATRYEIYDVDQNGTLACMAFAFFGTLVLFFMAFGIRRQVLESGKMIVGLNGVPTALTQHFSYY